jgi:DNA polymerase III epsilon subunit-like protein
VADVNELLQRDLVFLDCEMTGGDADRNEIIEIGCVRTRLPRLPVVAEYGVKVAPRTMRGSDKNSVRIAHYNPREWKNALPIEQALDQLREFTEGCLLVGWATHNDLVFLYATAERLGVEPLFADGYLELQDWAQRRFGTPRSPGLQRIADQLKIVRDEEHSALEDALVTYEVFRMLWRFGPDELREELPQLDWNSYAELSGEIELGPSSEAARRDELSPFVVSGYTRETLSAKRRG